MDLFFIAMSSLLGLIFGSFLNALAYRLPRKESLFTRSHCTSCMKQITAWENIPVISWVALRGKCSKCKEPISPRYLIVEAFTALLFGLLAAFALTFGEAFIAVAIMFYGFAFVGIALALIDLDTRRLPSKLIYGGAIVVLAGAGVYQIITDETHRLIAGGIAAFAYLAAYFIMWLVKPGAMGFGDVRLAPLTGFVLGWIAPEIALIGFFLPSFLALLWMLPQIIKKQMTGKTAIPFGPWMILGSFVAIIFSDILSDVYLRLGGI